MRIYLVRHGETSWNKEERIQGDSQNPLNERGRQQAEAIKSYLKDISFDKVYTSNLKRAVQTAEILTNLPLIKSSDLDERSFGVWQTMLWSDISKNDPALKKHWECENVNFAPEGGESIKEMVERVQNYFKKILKTGGKNETILLVIHGGPLKAIINFVRKEGLDKFSSLQDLKNCSISCIDYGDEAFHMTFLNKVVV